MARTITKITESVARKFYEEFCATIAHGLPPVATVEQSDGSPAWYEISPKLCRNLEDTCAFGIAWEEGDYDWVFWDDIRDLAKKHGIFVEPINGWAIGFYPV